MSRPTPKAIHSALLARAGEAEAAGDLDAARRLRAFADTVRHDAGAVSRVRERVFETANTYDKGDRSPIAQVWRQALADIDGVEMETPRAKVDKVAKLAPVAAPVQVMKLPPIAPQRQTNPPPARRIAAKAPRGMKTLLAKLVTLEAKVAALEAAALKVAEEPVAIKRLRGERLSDGRTWLDLVREIAEKHNVPVEHVAGDSRLARDTAARAEVWWWLRHKSGMRYSLEYIGNVWSRNHTTVMTGIRGHETRAAAAIAAPASGPRATTPAVPAEPRLDFGNP